MLGPGFNSVLPCILTTSSTSREIISIALGDYSDHSLKSLNCTNNKKVICGSKRPSRFTGQSLLVAFRAILRRLYG